MIAVFSAYREAPGEWDRRVNFAKVWAERFGVDMASLYHPVGAHTREEAEMMVGECVRRGDDRLYIVTSVAHGYRALLTVLKVLLERGLEYQIGAVLWPVPDAREAAKIREYQAKGDVATEAEATEYTQWWQGQCAT